MDQSGLVTLLMLTVLCVMSNGLECGMANGSGENLRNALNQCVKNNATINEVLQMAAESNEDSSSYDSQETNPTTVKSSNNNNTQTDNSNINLKTSRRSRRSPKTKQFIAKSRNQQLSDETNPANKRQSGQSTTTLPTTVEEEQIVPAMQDQTENQHSAEDNNENNSDLCVLQCILEQMNMTDSKGFPDHEKFVDGILQTASGRELRDFLQESIDECFQKMDDEETQDSCVYSAQLSACLVEKMRSNCADWPIGNLPFLNQSQE